MATRQALLQKMSLLFDGWKRANEDLNNLYSLHGKQPLDPDTRQSCEEYYRQDRDRYWSRLNDALEEYDRFPDRFDGLLRDAGSFWRNGTFERSVFIMTKFPDPADVEAGRPEASQLKHVIDTVKQAIERRGYIPRIADQAVYRDWLWDNVQFHLLCCKYGIAIVEDKSLAELNPNVALEWGWMLGMGRTVIFLKEQDFARGCADWSGRIHESFDWNNPQPGIERAARRLSAITA
jgi:hypothetical protein